VAVCGTIRLIEISLRFRSSCLRACSFFRFASFPVGYHFVRLLAELAPRYDRRDGLPKPLVRVLRHTSADFALCCILHIGIIYYIFLYELLLFGRAS